jgi:hypothetical protein
MRRISTAVAVWVCAAVQALAQNPARLPLSSNLQANDRFWDQAGLG